MGHGARTPTWSDFEIAGAARVSPLDREESRL